MARKLTSEELREPDIEIHMRYGRKWSLPRKVQEALNTYGTGYSRGNYIVYVLPAYRARELEEMMAREMSR